MPVEIIDGATGALIEAELFDDVTVNHFIEAHAEWQPYTQKAGALLKANGRMQLFPQHYGWDWRRKAQHLQSIASHFYGIRHAGKLQGLMKLDMVGNYSVARHPSQQGKTLIYVDYLEAAPWNVKNIAVAYNEKPRYRGIGTTLMEAAVRKSMDEGFKGRLALHSLPLAEPFYQNVCEMIPVGKDPGKQDLLWFEYTSDQATKFLGGT